MKGWMEMKERVKEWMDELTEGLKGRNHVKKNWSWKYKGKIAKEWKNGGKIIIGWTD